MSEVKLVDIRSNFRPLQTIEAAEAHYNEGSKTWRLVNVNFITFRQNGTVESTEKRPSLELEIPVDPSKLRKERRLAGELSSKELAQQIRQGDLSGAATLNTKVDFHVKWAFPFAAFVVSLVGLRFGYKSERTTETAKGILVAFGLGMSYWIILNAGTTMAKHGTVSPMVGAWLANFVILSVAAFDLWRSRKA